MNETIALRALAGFVFVDATTNAIVTDTLDVVIPGVTLKSNRSGVFTIFDVPAARAATSAPGTFVVTVSDPARRYLARTATVTAPASPATAAPARITLYPSPARPVAPNWAVVRASIAGASPPNAPMPWSTVQITRTSDGQQLARGLADERGEALVAIQGLKRQTGAGADGPVTEAATPVSVTASFDTAVAGRPAGWIPDPSALRVAPDPAVKSAAASLSLAPGETVFTQLSIPA
ncbi:MAG TPA: hypothetical protein VHT53_03735 [Candidatus Elarobacter sp.]|nr:hypothetical protein [Candidatus Elarobacter sp.]